MTDPNTDISGLVELLIAPLVEFPDEVEVTSTETEDGSTLIEVSVNPGRWSRDRPPGSYHQGDPYA